MCPDRGHQDWRTCNLTVGDAASRVLPSAELREEKRFFMASSSDGNEAQQSVPSARQGEARCL
ncbi:MAG: hypothetical protein MJZ12_07500 [Prevotella sp.]|nr:hypothetical protein [Prevotella sp.]